MARASAENGTKVEGLKHKDKRVNIPTEELRDFVEREEAAPQTTLYPRDLSLDPQLVWKGKDEQDAGDLGVSIVPIYIQEKIHPQAIVEDIRAQVRGERVQAALFADFNGLEFEQLIEFYQHEQNWSNRLILGDSLHVMTALAEKEGLRGKVQMIYIDPPYGIKFGSNWQVSTRKRDVKDGKAEDLTRQPEQIRAFRDTWKLGIHSYLAYLRDRLVVARELLTETGSIFVQIGDENVHLVRCLLDEVFGAENFCSQITVNKAAGQSSKLLAGVNDYLLWYARDRDHVKSRGIFTAKPEIEDPGFRYICVETPDGDLIDLTYSQKIGAEPVPRGDFLRLVTLTSQTGGETSRFPHEFAGASYLPPGARGWSTNPEGLQRVENAGRMYAFGKTLCYKRYHRDFPFREINNLWNEIRTGGFQDTKIYVVQTACGIIERCLLMTTDPGDLVLDPTCGSGTTAHVAEQRGRRWITIDTSRVALALARTRLMAAKYPYYLLADSPEGMEKEYEITARVPRAGLPATEKDIKKGFVYKRVPHITLKSIANNEEIGVIHAEWQERLEPIQTELNRLLKKSWDEWEVPREPEEKWPARAKTLLEDWWRLRRERQKEIDDSIARHAETELLFNDPYEDPKRIRVTGPFTVESLSPHRVLAAEEQRPATESAAQSEDVGAQFEMMVIENLRRAGVENTKKNERLRFDRLEPYPGTWIQAAGEHTDAKGKTRRVAVSIGPQYGTVPPEQVKEAAKEAVRGLGFDVLVVCGFAFDPHVAEETTRYGKLMVLAARMNADLLIGGDLLKKTATGNLFMVFGEPDVEVKRIQDGKIQVSVRGVDIYDPTTGEIRSSSTDDIACWFIDTEYNEESFFVRHAYFTGADQPYEKLKRALRAEVDEAAWASLYSTTSRPFDPPKTGKIAVKVINHYGDEVLKVYEVKR